MKQVLLNWSAVSGATAYKVYYGTSSGVYGLPIDAGNITQYPVSGLNDGTMYYFTVTAVSVNGESSKSNEISAATLPPFADGGYYDRTDVNYPRPICNS